MLLNKFIYFMIGASISLKKNQKVNLHNNIHYQKNYFLNNKKLNKIEEIYTNKYLLKRILYEVAPLILLSFFHLNNIVIFTLCILQLILTKNFLNLITCFMFLLYFNLQENNPNILKIYGIYLMLLFLIEVVYIYNYIPINRKFLSSIGVIFSFIILSVIYENLLIKNLIIFSSFLIVSTGVIPFNIENTLTKVKKNKKNIDTSYNSYYFM
jgi:hypothetical protein